MTYIQSAGGGGAPTNATYLTQTPNASLANEQALNALTDGVLKHASGVVARAVPGTDYSIPGHTHGQSDVTGLTSALAGKQGVGTLIERDFGSVPVFTGLFTITDATISGSSRVVVVQAPGPYTGKGTRADEAEMDEISCVAYPGSGSAVVRWRTGWISLGPRATGAAVRSSTSAILHLDQTALRAVSPIQIGRVRGNFKFYYWVE